MSVLPFDQPDGIFGELLERVQMLLDLIHGGSRPICKKKVPEILMQGGLISRSLQNEQLQLTTPLLDSGARDKAFCTRETLQARTGHRFSSDVL